MALLHFERKSLFAMDYDFCQLIVISSYLDNLDNADILAAVYSFPNGFLSGFSVVIGFRDVLKLSGAT